jgi:hypothetical protein
MQLDAPSMNPAVHPIANRPAGSQLSNCLRKLRSRNVTIHLASYLGEVR